MNRKKKISLLLALALAVSLFSGFMPANAAGDAQPPNADGYIIKLKDPDAGTAVLQDAPDLREIVSSEGLYHADSLDEVEALGSRVESFEPDYKVRLFDLPNDKYISNEWSITALNMPAVWSAGYTGRGVRVGVIDSGINAAHEDFAGADITQGLNVLDRSHDVTDENGHGTIVSGVLAETKDNGIGFAGLTPDVTLVPIKCFGKSKETSASYIVAALYAAADDYGCDVINLSLGMTEDTTALKQAIAHAVGKGVLVVSAVGNDGTAVYNYPAAYGSVVGVGSVDKSGSVSSFSQKNDSVYVVAPGVDIYGPSSQSSTGYAKGSGTSFSCPHAAAAAVILKQYAKNATYLDFETILRRSVQDGGAAGYDTSYGWGSLDMASLVQEMQSYDFRDISIIFPDLAGNWATQNIRYSVSAGLFNGTTAVSFSPSTNMSRAMFVTVLSRMSGQDLSGYGTTFSDVPDEQWFSQACNWGAAKNIVAGNGDGTFSPYADVTREQIAVFLYRYAQQAGVVGATDKYALSGYTDRASVSSWAKDAMIWAVSKGYISGRTTTTLTPQATATRAEVATITARFLNSTGA